MRKVRKAGVGGDNDKRECERHVWEWLVMCVSKGMIRKRRV